MTEPIQTPPSCELPSQDKKPPTSLSRRGFFSALAAASTSLVLPEALASPDLTPRTWPDLSKIGKIGSMIRGQGFARAGYVVDVRHPFVYTFGMDTPKTALVGKMMSTLITTLTGQKTPHAAWSRWFGPGDRVGILIDAQGDQKTRVRSNVLAAVAAGVRSAGVRENDIVIWAIQGRDLAQTGLSLNWSDRGLRVVGADQIGYDGRLGLRIQNSRSAVPGLLSGGSQMAISKLLTGFCTHVINIASLEDHPIIGCRLALAQQAISSFQNGSSLERHWGGRQGIADAASMPFLRGRFVLHLIDGLAGTYDGDRATWYPQVLLGSTDPVALDSVGFNFLDGYRRRQGLEPISNSQNAPAYIANAALNGVGIANLDQIKHQIVTLS